MVIIKNDPRKEATYGWYPSGTNVYSPKNAARFHERERLFRSFDGAGSRRVAWTPASAPAQAPGGGGAPRSPTQLTVIGSRPPVFGESPPSALAPRPPRAPSSANVLRPASSSWKFGRTADTAEPLIPTPSRSELGLRSSPSSESLSIPSSAAQSDSEPAAGAAARRGDRRRAKSAVERCWQRETSDAAPPDDAGDAPRCGSFPLGGGGRHLRRPTTATAPCSRRRAFEDEGLAAATTRPPTPTASQQPGASDYTGEASPTAVRPLELELGGDGAMPSPPTYDEQLDRYGWKAEIPGDPLNLKAITQRLPYTLNCLEPAVRPNPPSVCVMDNNTFFYNTIPRRPMSFTVHPEWQSELFVAKRIDLEKRGSGKFHTRSYAFAY